VTSTGSVAEDDVLRFAAALEHGSEHPLAAAILTAAKRKTVDLPPVDRFASHAGTGIEGTVGGRQVLLGNAALMQTRNVDVAAEGSRAERMRSSGQTVMFLAIDGALAGVIAVADPIKSTTADAIAALHAEGLRIVMLTGDHETTARAVASTLKIDDVRAGVLPADKQQVIRELQQQGRVVAMAGDGVNDAPALAAAAVGIAMGTGTDVAIESAGITLLRGDLRGIARARRLSRATMRNIRQNLVLAFVYNVAALPLAATGFLNPVVAGAAMAFSSIFVVSNSLRLRRFDSATAEVGR
jgi:Cu+-exporting ATPase